MKPNEEDENKKIKEIYEKEVKNLKEMSEKIKYSLKYKDHFETEVSYYIIRDYYENTMNVIIEEYHLNEK